MQRVMGVLLADPPQAVEEARTVLAQKKEDGEQSAVIVNLVETILVYKLPTLTRERIQAMLELTDIDLKQTRFYQDVFAEGRQEGEVSLVLRQLQRRCGPLPSAVHEHIGRLDVPRLEALGEALLEFRSLADVEHWLAVYGQ